MALPSVEKSRVFEHSSRKAVFQMKKKKRSAFHVGSSVPGKCGQIGYNQNVKIKYP